MSKSLIERLDRCTEIISNLCKEGRCPKMSIPVHSDDEDVFMVRAIMEAIATLTPVLPDNWKPIIEDADQKIYNARAGIPFPLPESTHLFGQIVDGLRYFLSPVLPDEVESIVEDLEYEASIGGILEGNAADLIERLSRENARKLEIYHNQRESIGELQARIDELEKPVLDPSKKALPTEAVKCIEKLQARITYLETWINENYPGAFVEPKGSG